MTRILIVSLFVVTLAIAAYAFIRHRNAEFSKDAETGGPCPGLALTYDCDIAVGGYLNFRIGMTSQEVFDIICEGSSVRFRYAGLDAQNVPEAMWKKRPESYYVPTRTYSPGAATSQEFCGLSEVQPYAIRYYVRRNRLWPLGDLIVLALQDGRLHSIHLGTGAIDL